MRRVVKPLEMLLTSHKRIVLKDSAVSWLVEGRDRDGRQVFIARECLLDCLSSGVCPSVSVCTGECSVLRSQGTSPRGAALRRGDRASDGDCDHDHQGGGSRTG